MNHLTVNQMNQFTVSLLIDNNQTLQVLKWHTADSTSYCWPVIVSIIQRGDFCLSVWKFKHFPQLENVFVLNLPTKWAHDSIKCLKLIIIVWTHNWRDQFHSFNLICFLMRIFNHCDWIGTVTWKWHRQSFFIIWRKEVRKWHHVQSNQYTLKEFHMLSLTRSWKKKREHSGWAADGHTVQEERRVDSTRLCICMLHIHIEVYVCAAFRALYYNILRWRT